LWEGFHEGLGAWLSDGTEVGNEFLLGHADTSINEGEGVGGFVGDDLDFEWRLVFGDVRISKGSVSDLV
jgi:hypothetical protein